MNRTPGTLAADFARDGWVVVRGGISAADIASYLEGFDACVPAVNYPRRKGGVVWEVGTPSRHHPALMAAARNPRLGALAAEVLACASVQLLNDTLLYKPARQGGPVEWHQDYTYVGYLVPPQAISIRIALVAEDADSGAQHVVSGSHHWGPLGDVRALSDSKVDSIVPLLSPDHAAQLANARTLALEPGDISIHHCLTLHGSPPNRSDRHRKTLVLRMFDAASRCDATLLPAAMRGHFPADADGRLSTDAFPVVHPPARD